MSEFKKIGGEELGTALLGPLLNSLIEIRDGLEKMVTSQEAKISILKGQVTGTNSSEKGSSRNPDSVDYVPNFPDDGSL
jgi:hypothetical protein